jgi:small-conductance mechanosensitive channel
MQRIEESLEALAPRIAATTARVEKTLAESASLAGIEDLRHELTEVASPLEGWQATIEGEAARLAASLELLGDAEARWSRTLARPETAEAGEIVSNQVRASLDLVREVRGPLRAWRSQVLALGVRVGEQRAAVTAALARLDEAASAVRTNLLVPDRSPIWRSGFAAAFRNELPRAANALSEYATGTADYVRRDLRPLFLQLLLAGALALLFREAYRRARRRAQMDPELLGSARTLERYVSIGLLVALLATPAIHPQAPQRFTQLMAVFALFPVWRIVQRASEGTSRVTLGGLLALLVLDRLGLALGPLPALDQAVTLISLAAALALAFWVVRRGGIPGSPRLVRTGGRLVAFALAVALLAEVGGWTSLAVLIERGVLAGVLAAIYLWATVVAVDALLLFALRTRFERVGPVARERARRLVRWLGAVAWLYMTLSGAGLREIVGAALRAVLEAGVTIGALSLTIGGVLTFALTLLLAPLLARLVDVVLQGLVYPRAQLPRGVPYALSTLTRYGVYTAAFLAALAAAGVQLGQLSILLGGLGVGVGLGLQDVVKNFAAGLTLLLERRVHVGDVIQLQSREIYGRVLEIGMRAALVRNWDGAEVVVPNADLIAGAVTNWTLSDRLRRIELPVGVAYGTEPQDVVKILLEVAGEHEDVLDRPPPQALFLGFGESSLDFALRVWIDTDYDRTMAFRSELALATHRRLSEAGITIPFPQRDLHLASVSPAVSAALGRSESR